MYVAIDTLEYLYRELLFTYKYFVNINKYETLALVQRSWRKASVKPYFNTG